MDEIDILTYVHRFKISHFRGIFMRDNLPRFPRRQECAIINLDSIYGSGTHWTAYYKHFNDVYYFDSYGNLPPPLELIQYFGNRDHIYYNTNNYQKFDSTICGQLCIMFLNHIYEKKNKKINKNIIRNE